MKYLYAFKMQIMVALLGSALFYGLYALIPSTLVLILWGIGLIVIGLDFKSRLKEFLYIRKRVIEKPSRKNKYLKAQAFAPCRRNATAVAIGDIEYANAVYRSMGYRWYHLIPDDFFKKAQTMEYWKAALFK